MNYLAKLSVLITCHFVSDFQKHLDEIKAKVFNKENSKSFIEKTAPLFSKTNLETAKNSGNTFSCNLPIVGRI